MFLCYFLFILQQEIIGLYSQRPLLFFNHRISLGFDAVRNYFDNNLIVFFFVFVFFFHSASFRHAFVFWKALPVL